MADIALRIAVGIEWYLCRDVIQKWHYLHTFPDPRCMPVVYSVRLGGEWVGCLVFGRTQCNRCFAGEVTYGGRADVAAGKARFDRWEVLSLARVWLSPAVQSGGTFCVPGTVPGFMDRKGIFRSTLASAVVRAAIAAVRFDYLLLYPPCFVEEPYQVRVILSYCDTRVHRGVIYRASGFRLGHTNRQGVETWYTEEIAPLDPDQDRAVREAARKTDRSIRKRNARGWIYSQGSLFGD